jgi:O-antigen ligase
MRRSYVIFAVSLLLFAVASIQHSVAWMQHAHFTRGVAYPLRDYPLPPKVPTLGVNVDLLQYTATELDLHLTNISASGIRWVRQYVAWDDVEPEPGSYEWAAYDQIFAALARHSDVRPVVVLWRTPRWAASAQYPPHPTLPAADPAAFAAFAAEFALRYGTVVDHYQIWDEPNLYEAWGRTNPNATHYLAILSSAYHAIHAVDADAVVISAGLAPTTEMSGRNISDWIFLEELYALGLNGVSDAISAKPYGFDSAPHDRTVEPQVLNFSRVVRLREIMVANGAADKHIWFANWGWNTLPAGWTGLPSPWRSVTPAEQVEYTLQALRRIETEWPWAGGAMLNYWQPAAGADAPEWGFALLDRHNEASPLLLALRSLPATQLPSNGFFSPRNPFAAYSGVWSFSELGADIGWLETSDSQISFRFSGSDVGVVVREGDYSAFLYPRLINAFPNRTQRDSSGNPYIYLRSQTGAPQIVVQAIASNLPPGPQNLHLVADRGWDQWALVGFAVSDGDLTLPYSKQVNLAAVGLFAAACALVISAVQLPWRPLLLPLRHLMRPLSGLVSLMVGMVTSFAFMLSLYLLVSDGAPAIIRKDAFQLGSAYLVSLGLIALEPAFPVALLCCVLLFIIFFNRPETGLLLTLFWAPFFLFPVELYRFAFPLSELLLLLTFLAWLCRRLAIVHRDHVPLRALVSHYQPLDGVVLATALVAAAAVFWSPLRDEAFTELRTLFAEPALFYFILRAELRTPQALRRAVWALVASAVAVSVIGLVLFASGSAIITAEDGAQRLASVYGSPNNVALLLGRAVPFVLAAVLFAPPGRSRIVAACLLILLIVTSVLTQSTGGIFIGVPAGIAVVLLWRFGRRAVLPLAGLAAALLAAGLVLSSVSERFAKLLTITEGTNFIRLRVWESTLSMLSDFPLTGVGLDQFLYYYRGTYIRPDALFDRDLSHPHNFVLDYWTRLGILGVVLLIAVQLAFWRGISRLASLPTVPRMLLVGAAGAMSATLAHGLVDNSIFVVDLALIHMLLLAVVANLRQVDWAADQNLGR